jgi:hypothetical protein
MKNRYRYWGPLPTLRAFGEIIPSRESATIWLWVRPRLLGWDDILWLDLQFFESCWCLWGIDKAGDLLIVEVRFGDDKALQDPFAGLVDYGKTHSHKEWTTKKLRSRLRQYLRLGEHVAEFAKVLVPVDHHLFERAVEQAFERREAAGNPPPIFVAVVPSLRSEFDPSERGLKNQLFLESLVGSARVLARAISGSQQVRGLRIHSWDLKRRKGTVRKRARVRRD